MWIGVFALAGLTLVAPLAAVDPPSPLPPGACEYETSGPVAAESPDDEICADTPPLPGAAPAHDPLIRRLLDYAKLAVSHRVSGLASYYASFFDGRKTANGEIFRNRKYSAAHRTLPLGTWVEVKSRATGRTLRLRVNDRGPYAKKFVLDLSQAAARFLGVDVARDRHVDIRVIALPGEEPPPEDLVLPDVSDGSVDPSERQR